MKILILSILMLMTICCKQSGEQINDSNHLIEKAKNYVKSKNIEPELYAYTVDTLQNEYCVIGSKGFQKGGVVRIYFDKEKMNITHSIFEK